MLKYQNCPKCGKLPKITVTAMSSPVFGGSGIDFVERITMLMECDCHLTYSPRSRTGMVIEKSEDAEDDRFKDYLFEAHMRNVLTVEEFYKMKDKEVMGG